MTLAILVDTTGSMAPDLPVVKNAVARLLTFLKTDDSVGLFSFANRLTRLSAFTTDRKAALGAILKTRASGRTALFDSLAQLSREVAGMTGKKAIVLFTDGDDNSSLSAKSVFPGIPVRLAEHRPDAIHPRHGRGIPSSS